jgi:hypothetical protein
MQQFIITMTVIMDKDDYRKLTYKCIKCAVDIYASELNQVLPYQYFIMNEVSDNIEEVKLLTIDEFIDLTFVDGSIYRWIDINVNGVEDDCVVLSYLSSKDLTFDLTKTVYFKRDQGPFGIKLKCGIDGKPKDMRRHN